MAQAQLAEREGRVSRETFVIIRSDEGFRVYSPATPSKIFAVGGGLEAPTCTCSDFEREGQDRRFRCRHILAVIDRLAKGADPEPEADFEDQVEREERLAIREEARGREIASLQTDGASRMVLKRSVSPDGRIDSLSVEFTSPVTGPSEEILARARGVLRLQSGIVGEFLGSLGPGDGRETERPPVNDGIDARLLDVAGTNTRYGRRLFISVRVNGNVLRLFGSRKQLAESVEAAGFPDLADQIHEGAQLNVPCRVTTKRSEDGRYVNIDKVFQSGNGSRGNGRRA